MSCTTKGNDLPAAITDAMVAALVSGILRQEQPKSDAPMKRIELATGVNRNSISKWYNGSNAPKSSHLLMLAKAYPNILRMMLEIIERGDVWELCVKHSIPQKMTDARPQKPPRPSIYSDRFVSINVVVDSLVSGQLNQRQLWFLGRLQQGISVKAEDIVPVWRTTFRTARRDIAGLVAARIICFTGARKKGRYELYDRRKAGNKHDLQ